MKPLPHKKMKFDSHREVENEHIYLLHPKTHRVDNMKLKNIKLRVS